MIDPKEIKQEIRRLKKLKLQCRPGSKERIELHRQIKDLKKQIAVITISEPGKDSIIVKILKVEAEQGIKPRFADIGIDLHKFSIPELQKHLDLITKRGRA